MRARRPLGSVRSVLPSRKELFVVLDAVEGAPQPPDFEDDVAGEILVQEQIVGGVEVFLGLQSSPGLGTFILAGLGEIWTELVDDVQIRPAGLDDGEAEEMLGELRAYRQLQGARGRPPVRLDVVAETIMRLDAIGLAAGERIQSLDINPLIVREGEAIVADALLIPAKQRR